ncbi:GIY-YIG nuclease family protein [Hydrogenophaga sp.]|uniref:GIY-YIG nuclease family protein n=1 Tax=Hydrogenophaga sp. TaxID=1904254 RepID=UPI002FCB96E2
MNSHERTEYIYVLLDSQQQIFYCGRSRNIEKRLREHIEEAMAGGRSMKCCHIRDLIERGDHITVKQVDQAPTSKIAELEAWWIDRLDCSGDFGYVINLRNGNAGSQGNAIDEVQLRKDIQEHRRKLKKRKHVFKEVGKPPAQERLLELGNLYENDRPRFNREYAAHLELQRDRAKAA